MILLDTSALIGSLAQRRASLPVLVALASSQERLNISTLVLYEWLRGPRTGGERRLQEEFFPSHQAIRYGAEEAVISAGIYRQLPRARSREFDLAIAACAITQGARLWTLNLADFADIPGLQLFRPDVA